jgi:hypothetical protein
MNTLAPSDAIWSPWQVRHSDFHSQAKATEDNGAYPAHLEGHGVTGVASRASVGAGTDASIPHSLQAGSPSRGAVAPSSSGIESGPANQFPHSPATSSRQADKPEVVCGHGASGSQSSEHSHGCISQSEKAPGGVTG